MRAPHEALSGQIVFLLPRKRHYKVTLFRKKFFKRFKKKLLIVSFDFQVHIGRNPTGEPFFAIVTEDSKEDQYDPNCWFLNESNADKLFDYKEEIISIMSGSMDENKFLKVHSKVEEHKHIMDQKDLSPKEVKKQVEDQKSKSKKVQIQQQKSIAKMTEEEKYCHECYRKSYI